MKKLHILLLVLLFFHPKFIEGQTTRGVATRAKGEQDEVKRNGVKVKDTLTRRATIGYDKKGNQVSFKPETPPLIQVAGAPKASYSFFWEMGDGSFSKDIPHYCAAQRVNRITGLNVIGLKRQGFTADDRAAIKELFHLLFDSGLNLTQALERAVTRQWSEKAMRLLEFVQAPSKKGVCPVRPGREDD